MYDKELLPFELAARLALLGFNEPCISQWGRSTKPRVIKPRTCHDCQTYWHWELKEDRHDLDSLIQSSKNGLSLDIIFRGRNVAAVGYEAAMDWFTKVYNIDFIERPSIAATKKYVCDPVGPGFANVRLEAKADKYAARLQCLEYLVARVKAKIEPFNQLNDVEYEEEPETCEVGPND